MGNPKQSVSWRKHVSRSKQLWLERKKLWQRSDRDFRDPAGVAGHSSDSDVDPRLLQQRVTGPFWDILKELDLTFLVTREYEHLVLALSGSSAERVSYLRLPHPSGLTVDVARKRVYIASTRNPNQLFSLAPATSTKTRLDCDSIDLESRPLVPTRSIFLPGCLYMHDLAMIGGALHANAVGENAVVRIDDDGNVHRAWWPQCAELDDGPVFGQNHLQLNSIAAGRSIKSSYFSASTDVVSARRPGHHNFPVDKCGVIFSGRTREVIARGLTRPHSARLHNDQIWVDNSGYGEVGYIDAGHFHAVARLPGWTRGLCIRDNFLFVGTSHIIRRFEKYAPGLDADKCACGVHVVDLSTGQVVARIIWPFGYQIFSIEAAPASWTSGFPCRRRRAKAFEKNLFYTFKT